MWRSMGLTGEDLEAGMEWLRRNGFISASDLYVIVTEAGIGSRAWADADAGGGPGRDAPIT